MFLFILVSCLACNKDNTEISYKLPIAITPSDSLRNIMLGNWVNRKAFVDGNMIINDANYFFRITKDTIYRMLNPNLPFALDTLEMSYIYDYSFIKLDSLSFMIQTSQGPFAIKRNIYIYNKDSIMINGIVESNLPIFPRAGDLILTKIK